MLHKKPSRKINYRYFNPLRSTEVKKTLCMYFFKGLYKTNFYLKVYYLQNAPLNFFLIILKIKNFMNIFAKNLNFREDFYQIFLSC